MSQTIRRERNNIRKTGEKGLRLKSAPGACRLTGVDLASTRGRGLTLARGALARTVLTRRDERVTSAIGPVWVNNENSKQDLMQSAPTAFQSVHLTSEPRKR